MTDENIRSEDADSGRIKTQKLQADVLAKSPPEDPDVYLVEYPDGEQLYEPATMMNTLLFEDGLYEQVVGRQDFYKGSDRIASYVDIENKNFKVDYNGHTVRVPEEDAESLIDAHKHSATATKLEQLYNQIMDGRVREDLINKFDDRYPDGRIEKTDDGWVVDETFLINYEGENYLIDAEQTYVRSGNEMIEADESKQAVELQFDVDDEITITKDDGETVDLGTDELQFLATVECLLYPGDYLDAELVDDIEQYKAEAQIDTIGSVASQATIQGYTDTKTGNYHRHSFNKHRASEEVAEGVVDQELGLTEEAVDKLYFNDYDHAAPHELMSRREEFENAPFDIFTDDVSNDNNRRWIAIEKAKEKAPIHPTDHEKIQSMFSDYNDTVDKMGKW